MLCAFPQYLFLLPATMSQTKKIQGKIFRGENTSGDGAGPSRSSSEPVLTIEIPKPTLAQPSPAPPKVAKTEPEPRQANAERPSEPFRHRLLKQLGVDYHGVERHRLVQDERKELHWKRWGPYLSDRQWVSTARTSRLRVKLTFPIGNRPRGLFRQR